MRPSGHCLAALSRTKSYGVAVRCPATSRGIFPGLNTTHSSVPRPASIAVEVVRPFGRPDPVRAAFDPEENLAALKRMMAG
jgi:hypothetical protein